MDFQLRHLRSLVAVAEELHFGRAAVRLGISQPVVSRHVRALESALGALLLIRTARATELTDAGREVLADAREALAAAERMAARATATASGAVGNVTVGFVWTTIDPYLAAVVDEMATQNPEIELAVTHLRWIEVPPSLRRGSVDLVISRSLPEPHEMHETVIHTEPYLLAVPARHHFAARESVRVEELEGEPIIAFSRSLGPAGYDAALEAIRARGVEPEIAIHASSPQVRWRSSAGLRRLPYPRFGGEGGPRRRLHAPRRHRLAARPRRRSEPPWPSSSGCVHAPTVPRRLYTELGDVAVQ